MYAYRFLHFIRRRKHTSYGSLLALTINLALPLYGMVPAKAETLFSEKSPWNVAMPTTASFGSTNIALGLPVGLDTWDPNGYWVVPFHQAKEGDPKVRILYNPLAWGAVYSGAWHRIGNDPAVEADILASSSSVFPYPGNVFSSTSVDEWTMPESYNALTAPSSEAAMYHVPASGMVPATGADGHMAVHQPNGGILETYATIVLSDLTLVALSYSVTDEDSLGDGWQRGQTASMLPSYAGAILDSEIETGINHAIAITVPPKLLAPKFQYPAYAFDRDALSNDIPYSGKMPMGGRLGLPPDLDILKLGLRTKAGIEIAKAAFQHGFLIVDRGGEGVTLRVRPTKEPTQPRLHTYDPELSADLQQIFAHLVSVTF